MESRSVLRIYSETLPHDELVRPSTVRLLRTYGLELVLAVRPWDLPALPRVAGVLRDAGVPLAIWPMLADEDGRWANVENSQAFSRLVDETCATLGSVADVLLDLEPTFTQARSLASLVDSERERRWWGAEVQSLARLATVFAHRESGAFASAAARLTRTVEELHARGATTSSAVWPLVALDPPGHRSWQTLLGTPVDPLGVGHVSVMMYTSMLEGWSRGALRRPDVTVLLAAAVRRAQARWGARAGISLGCVGTGAFDDEPIYRGPEELAEDVAIARGEGCARLSLFDLGGVLSRGPPEAWLEAFVYGLHVGKRSRSPAPAPVRARARVHVARALARVATRLLDRSGFA